MPYNHEINVKALNAVSSNTLVELLGIKITKVEENSVEGYFQIQKNLFAPNGYLHAGSIVTLADTLAGYATVAHLPKGAVSFTTIELKSNFLSTAREGEVVAIATPEHLGNTTQVWDVVVTHAQSGKKMAIFRCTQLIIYPK
jgi:1,4-dihydroxy-2-naphthoyl-CoA hydrolase